MSVRNEDSYDPDELVTGQNDITIRNRVYGIRDKYQQGYIAGLKRHATVKFTRETVLATIGATDTDDARLAGSALFAAGYNDAVDDNLKLAHDAE